MQLKFYYFFYLILFAHSVFAYEKVENDIIRNIQYSYTLQNTTSSTISNAKFWTYAPVSKNNFQELKNIVSNHKYQMESDALENSILSYKFNQIEPFATKMVHIKALVKLSTNNQKQSNNPMNKKDFFLLSEKYIESNATEIKQISKKLIGGNDLETAENIYKWVSDNLKYAGYIKNNRGALWAIKNGKGDCTEFMYLFVALCRANGIPARGIAGYHINKNTIVDASDYHNWAEFYVDGFWRISDPQKKVFMQNQNQYIAMRVISHFIKNSIGDYNRYRFSGNGLKIKMKQ